MKDLKKAPKLKREKYDDKIMSRGRIILRRRCSRSNLTLSSLSHDSAAHVK